MARVDMDVAGFKAYVDEQGFELFDERLGPQIRDSAKVYAPKGLGTPQPAFFLGEAPEIPLLLSSTIFSQAERTGGEGDGPILYVVAPAPYALYVEEGHVNWRTVHGQFTEAGGAFSGPYVFVPQPYLRPALYQERAL